MRGCLCRLVSFPRVSSLLYVIHDQFNYIYRTCTERGRVVFVVGRHYEGKHTLFFRGLFKSHVSILSAPCRLKWALSQHKPQLARADHVIVQQPAQRARRFSRRSSKRVCFSEHWLCSFMLSQVYQDKGCEHFVLIQRRARSENLAPYAQGPANRDKGYVMVQKHRTQNKLKTKQVEHKTC